MTKKRKTKLLIFIGIIISIFIVGYYFTNSNKNKTWIMLNNMNLTKQEIKEEKISYALDLSYIADKNNLSKNKDDVDLMQEAKDKLYYFNQKTIDYNGICSVYYQKKCTFEVYRAYSDEYINIDNVKDHNTGYDVDLKLPNISRGQMKGHNTGDYILEIAKNYGYVNRYLYQEDRTDRYSHFRYVGVENAILMGLLDLSIDNYIKDFDLGKIYYTKSTNSYIYKVEIKDNKIKLPKRNDNYIIYRINNNQAIVVVNK